MTSIAAFDQAGKLTYNLAGPIKLPTICRLKAKKQRRKSRFNTHPGSLYIHIRACANNLHSFRGSHKVAVERKRERKRVQYAIKCVKNCVGFAAAAAARVIFPASSRAQFLSLKLDYSLVVTRILHLQQPLFMWIEVSSGWPYVAWAAGSALLLSAGYMHIEYGEHTPLLSLPAVELEEPRCK